MAKRANTEVLLGAGPPTPSLLGQPGQNFHPHFSQEETEVLRELTYPVARQVSGSAEIEPSSDLEGPHYTLSLWGTPSAPIKSLVIVSTYCRPEPVPRGGHVSSSLESQEARNRGGNGWRVMRTPRTPTALGSSKVPPEAVTFQTSLEGWPRPAGPGRAADLVAGIGRTAASMRTRAEPSIEDRPCTQRSPGETLGSGGDGQGKGRRWPSGLPFSPQHSSAPCSCRPQTCPGHLGGGHLGMGHGWCSDGPGLSQAKGEGITEAGQSKHRAEAGDAARGPKGWEDSGCHDATSGCMRGFGGKGFRKTP